MAQTTVQPQNDPIPELLNYRTLFERYGLHQSTISKLVMLGKFTNIVKVNSKNYFRKSDVEQWINNQTIAVS